MGLYNPILNLQRSHPDVLQLYKLILSTIPNVKYPKRRVFLFTFFEGKKVKAQSRLERHKNIMYDIYTRRYYFSNELQALHNA